MANRLIVEEKDGNIGVSLHWADHLNAEQFGDSVPFEHGLKPRELEDLRWYLEDYLTAPYAVWEEKGATIQAGLPGLGERLFDSVFGNGKPGLKAYQSAKGEGGFQLWFRSESPDFLGLPWELLKDPDYPTPVALGSAGLNRTIPVTAPAVEVQSGEALRVLMVIARPRGTRDIPYQMIARPMMERLELLSGKVQLEVVRPPTIRELKRRLKVARKDGRPYHVLHFDGHGALDQSRAGAGRNVSQQYQADEGCLVFVTESGKSKRVPASDFALTLKEAGIPLLVMNACQSGAVSSGVGAEASVATRLLHEGVASVVAMGYSVYAVAAAEFMTVFYEALLEGNSVAEAMVEARRQLHESKMRPSPKGPMPLEDWMVPVHYARREVRFPQAERSHPSTGMDSLSESLEGLRHQAAQIEKATDGPGPAEQLRADDCFFGRDAEFYELEWALPAQRVVVIHGVGGTGKTELAKAYARWLRDSGGLGDPRLVFFHSFEPGLASFNLDGVLTALGLDLVGPRFVLDFPAPEDRRNAVMKLLRDHRMLLIWDNFETVHSMPDPNSATPPLDDEQIETIRDFLTEVKRDARGSIMITSRSPELWLGDGFRRMEIAGLKPQDAALYADRLLSPYPGAQERREDRAYGELIDFLEGHPLSMRLILPHLDRMEPKALLDGLKGKGKLPPGFEGEEGRLQSLGASVYYSFRQLAEEHNRRLPALTFFESVVDADALSAFSQVESVPERFRDVSREDWGGTLDACAAAGLLTELSRGAGLYRMHPALPAYLTALWRQAAKDEFDEERESALRACIAAHAALGVWLLQQTRGGDADTAMAVLDLSRRTFCGMAAASLDRGMFAAAQGMLQPLNAFWDARGLVQEARGWVERCRDVLEDDAGNPPHLDTEGGALWLFMVGAEGIRSIRARDLDGAELIYRSHLSALEGSRSEQAQPRLAVTYHQLGAVAQDRGELNEADEWLRKSLEIEESLENRPGMAISYHQLGVVAQERGELKEAERWYRKSLEIKESLEDRPGMASTYHQLGMIAGKRGELKEAERWYRKSLEITEFLGNLPYMASTYHQIGIVAQARGDLKEAERWYGQSLEIKESLEDRRGMSTTYHQLGALAQERGDLVEAGKWYRKSLGITEVLGNLPYMASTYAQLGTVAQDRGDLKEAGKWYRKSLEIRESLQDRPGIAISYHQLGVVAQERGELKEAERWYRKSLEIKESLEDRPGMAMTRGQLGLLAEESGSLSAALDWTVRCVALFEEFPHPVTGPGPEHLKRLTEKLGIKELESSWRRCTGKPLPENVCSFVAAKS